MRAVTFSAGVDNGKMELSNLEERDLLYCFLEQLSGTIYDN